MATNVLLDFLLSLFANQDAADAYLADPEGTLKAHGLENMCSDDVDAVMPVVLDHSPVSFDRNYNTGGNSATGGNAGGGSGGGGGNGGGGNGGGGGGWGDDHAAAVQQLTHVLNNYSYTQVDDRDTILDQSVNQNIWANGDVKQLFDNEAVVVSGDHSIAAGDDVDDSGNTKIEDSYNTDNSINTKDSFNTKYDDSFNTKIEDSGNTKTETDNSINTKIEDSGNVDNSIDDSGNVKIEDSGNTKTEDSGNVKIEDSGNTKTEDSGNTTEHSGNLEIEDSFTYEDESFDQTNTDSTVVQGNEADFDDALVVVVP